jgi:4-hydroxythreonine-4-phosphate dehydrogenase
MPTLIITPGDPTGIGPEITVKALARLDEFPGTQFIVIGSLEALEKSAAQLNLALPKNDRVRYVPVEADEPGAVAYQALDKALQMIAAKEADTLVTGPISKRNLKEAGFDFPGHTEILEDLAHKYFSPGQSPPPLGGGLGGGLVKTAPPSAKTKAEMLFVHKKFRLLLLTRHLALKDVPEALSKPGAIAGPLKTLITFLRHKLKIEEPRIALLGLNPHAGEIGGEEEKKFLMPVIHAVNAIGASRLEGPFAADAFFRTFDAENPSHDAVVATYHDQGLIPFKLLAGYAAVNVTIGLPFLRTSVSHGTAEDIAGQGIAREDSLIAALHTALESL